MRISATWFEKKRRDSTSRGISYVTPEGIYLWQSASGGRAKVDRCNSSLANEIRLQRSLGTPRAISHLSISIQDAHRERIVPSNANTIWFNCTNCALQLPDQISYSTWSSPQLWKASLSILATEKKKMIYYRHHYQRQYRCIVDFG